MIFFVYSAAPPHNVYVPTTDFPYCVCLSHITVSQKTRNFFVPSSRSGRQALSIRIIFESDGKILRASHLTTQ